MERINELKQLITKYDDSYRAGTSIVPDTVYDTLVDELHNLIGEGDEFFKSSIKSIINTDRREQIPIIMASMNKVKTITDIQNWVRLKNIDTNTQLIISPKYDGISLAKEEISKKCWTRGGDNTGGLRSDEHLVYMNDVTIDAPYTFGEIIISRDNWKLAKESFEGDSARNGVSGLFRRDYTSSELEYVDFVRYGVIGKDFKTKSDLFDFLNITQKIKVPYTLTTLSNLTEDYLKDLFIKYSENYEIDGLIIEVNNISLWEDLGRERNGNPKWAVAYKGSFEEVGETICINIEYNISKDGNIIPVAILEPIKLDGAMIGRVTLNNYSFMKEMGIGIGSRVKIKRSGFVIPLIIEVLNKVEVCYPEHIDCYLDGVHLKTTFETEEQQKKKIFAFFNIIGVEDVSDKTFDLLYDSGYENIKEILLMTQEDFLKLDRFGEKKALKVYEAIHSKIKNIPLARLQHASSLFTSLGEKKLILLEHFETKPKFEDIIKIDGFSEISTNNYLNAIDDFWLFINTLPMVTWIRTQKVKTESDELTGKIFIFSGYRNKVAEIEIVKRNGIIGSGVTSKTSYLVMSEKGSGSLKEAKALELGITVLDKDELIKMLNL